MRGALAEKILRAHLAEGRLEPGNEIGIRIDQTLTQDATGTAVYLEFETMGMERVKNELAVSYIDHNVIQTDFRNAADHRFLQSAAARYGVILSPPGNGVSHHLHRQRFGRPGKTLLGSDSHTTTTTTTTGGSLSMLAMGAGGIRAFINAGARVHEPGCIGMGQAPATGTNSLRTFPRNFKGRSGTLDDAVYLCSPETAVASALTGRITDPRTMKDCPPVEYPARYSFNPQWFVYPPERPEEVELVKGPNIKPFPRFSALEDSVAGEVLLKVGDNVSTDVIMPAGNQVLPLRSNVPELSRYVFYVIDAGFADRAEAKGGGFVVGGENYGQGSSREHAALAPRYLGVRAKLAKSFARIHKENLIDFGILPLTFANPADCETVRRGDRIALRGLRRALGGGAGGGNGEREIEASVNGRPVKTILDVSARHRKILLAGGVLNLVRE